MPVDFDVKGSGICNIEVQLCRKYDNVFKRLRRQNQNINLDEVNHAYFDIDRIISPKRLRMVLAEQKNPIILNKIQFRNGKFQPDLNKFVVQGGRIEVTNDGLVVYPEQDSVILDYTDKLSIITAIKFDFKIFVIIAVLTFLFVYKISNYVAEFKTIKGKSRIEIIFLTVFFAYLFVPMSYINQDVISEKENRVLAQWKPFITKSGEINQNFGKDVNEWFNDRFNLRRELLKMHTTFSVLLTKEAEEGVIDRNGFLFLKSEINHSRYEKISEADYDALRQLNIFCRQNNIELYVLIVPDKSYVQIPSKKILLHDNYAEILNEKVKELNAQSGVKTIYPLEEMRQAVKQHDMYFRTEHHWTDDGAFVGYQAIMKAISLKHSDIKILDENDFNISLNNMVRGDWYRDYNYGSSADVLNLPKLYVKKLHKVNYRYFTYKNINNIKTKVIHTYKKRYKEYYNPEGANYRVIQLGTSHNENLTEFVPATFKNVLRIRNNSVDGISSKDEFKIIKYYKKQILDYKPDMIIFCISQANILQLHDIFNEEID